MTARAVKMEWPDAYGFAGAVATAPPSCATLIGCIANGTVAGMSLDAAHAGAQQLVSGQPEATMLNTALQRLGLSPEAAGYAEFAFGVGAAARAGSAAVRTMPSSPTAQVSSDVGSAPALRQQNTSLLQAAPESASQANAISSLIEPKIAAQLGKRGWSEESIEAVISNPARMVVTRDTRFDPATGRRLNDPATGYIANDGSYIVRNNRTRAIVQISDRNDRNWVAPWD